MRKPRTDEYKRRYAEHRRRWKSRNREKVNAEARARRARNPQKAKDYRRSWNLKRLESIGKPYPTNGLCQLCGGGPGCSRGGRLQWDHDHTTGKFRGWLCMHCNTGLGKLKESPELLRKAAEYLENAVLLS